MSTSCQLPREMRELTISIVGQAEWRESHRGCSLPEWFAVLPINYFWTLAQLAQRRSLGFTEMEQ